MLVKLGASSPKFGVNIKETLSCHHLVNHQQYGFLSASFQFSWTWVTLEGVRGLISRYQVEAGCSALDHSGELPPYVPSPTKGKPRKKKKESEKLDVQRTRVYVACMQSTYKTFYIYICVCNIFLHAYRYTSDTYIYIPGNYWEILMYCWCKKSLQTQHK